MMRGSPAAIGQLQWINGPFAHLHENVSDFIGRIKQFLCVSKASVNEPVVCALSWSENADNGQTATTVRNNAAAIFREVFSLVHGTISVQRCANRPPPQ